MGWRMAATLYPMLRKISDTRRVVWLLPEPVRTAHTETTGLVDFSWVVFIPISRKSAPAANTDDALCITTSWGMSLYANTTWSTFFSWINLSRSVSAKMGIPFG